MAAFPFHFERTVTTKVNETSPRVPPVADYVPPPPPTPREHLPHIAVKEAITAAADKAKELAASATTADDLGKVFEIIKGLDGLMMSNGRGFYFAG